MCILLQNSRQIQQKMESSEQKNSRQIQQKMESSEQKNSRRVSFWSAQHQLNDLQAIFDKISNVLAAHSISIPKQFSSGSLREISQDDSPRQKSLKLVWKQANQSLNTVQKLLKKELTDSLVVILEQTFDQNDSDSQGEIDFDTEVQLLMIFYGLLKFVSIDQENSFKLLKWVYDVLEYGSLPICMELSNVICSIKKKLIRLGCSIINKLMGRQSNERELQSGEQNLKALVLKLIKQKEKEVNQLRFQLCRVCESYQPLNSMAAHLKQCQRKYQLKYHQNKIQQKGNEIIANLFKKQQVNSKAETLFSKVFESFDAKNVIFKLKNNQEEIRQVLLEYEMENIQSFNSVIDLLKKYQEILKKDSGGQTLSDHDSKTLIKSKRYVSIRGFLPSSSSIQPESQRTMFLSHSEKTINSETQSHGRIQGCRLSDFQVIKKLGKGSYSEVYLVRKRNTRDLYAMKVIQFQDLNEQRMQAFKKEQKIYKSINGNFNVKLYYSFRQENLYFLILDFGPGGNFRALLENQVYIEQKFAKLYIANLILAVDAIHSMGIVHRDLKPENIVIGEDGHLILTDFNLSKLIKEPENGKKNTFFGTPDYIAPEVLKGQQVNEVIDWFSVGVIAYQMMIGVTPFTDFSQQSVFQNILKGQITWPQVGTGEDQISQDCKDFLEKMLNPDPKLRFGTNGIQQIKDHKFFTGVNWDKICKSDFMFIPSIKQVYEQNTQLLDYIQNKKKKISLELISSQISIVRYDILRQATNVKVRSHRNSRFKIEKQLQALKIQLGKESIKVKKQYSYNNFNLNLQEIKGQSCREFIDGKQKGQKNQ